MTAVLAHGAPPCPVEGCRRARSPQSRPRKDGTFRYHALCSGHETRRRKHGDPTVGGPLKHRTFEPWLHTTGHLRMVATGHPVATSDGHAYVHRVVLYDEIGPGAHPCHHCARPVSWFVPFPDGLVVDHLDFDRTNNALANLVPSCHPCNAGRGGNSAKTHCPHGHPYDKANTILSRHGRRVCRLCRQRHARNTNAIRKARRAAGAS